MIGKVMLTFIFSNLWGRDLPWRHGEAALRLVSMAQYTVVSRATISSVGLGLFTPEGVNNF
jgi:hypothetical protein